MNAILLGTQTYLWFVAKDPRLKEAPLRIVKTTAHVLLSVASLWEIGIKHGLGKFDVGIDLPQLIDVMPRANRITVLPIEPRHILRAAGLPFHHRDPFDRMIVAQALEEGLPIVGSDGAFDAYGVRRLF